MTISQLGDMTQAPRYFLFLKNKTEFKSLDIYFRPRKLPIS